MLRWLWPSMQWVNSLGNFCIITSLVHQLTHLNLVPPTGPSATYFSFSFWERNVLTVDEGKFVAT
jgi:hypothetical protein